MTRHGPADDRGLRTHPGGRPDGEPRLLDAQGRHGDRPGPLRAHRLDGRLRGLRAVRAEPARRAADGLGLADR
ncbi:hypothetical protein SBRY_10733 [Actinacidiphila bryophytorum]|uniref:Uncharacterized protein n=1 Tax=Actinacidiphila bryophytorum TaxID=1436133 RepID=A0A9W4ECL8_9ACTN|nr:hypothetical protein SBRY_10733 [Actinacidiphila bryophytorum]